MLEQISYTVIDHVARMRLGLSCEEYCVAALIYHTSNNPRAFVPGYSQISKAYIQEQLGISRASAFRHVKKLIKLGLVVAHETNTDCVKTTDLWYSTVITHPVSNCDTQSQNETPSAESQSQIETPLYIKINNKNKESNKLLSGDESPAPQKFGRDEVNYIIQRFRENWNQPSLDRNPRHAAWALVQNIRTWHKEQAKPYSTESFNRIFEAFLVWMNKQDYANMIQKIETLKVHFRKFKALAERSQNERRQ